MLCFFRCPKQEEELTRKFGAISYYMYKGRKVPYTECNATGKPPSKEARLLAVFLKGPKPAWGVLVTDRNIFKKLNSELSREVWACEHTEGRLQAPILY